jgi:bifunctional pyridoxal-dependent enzyme with beta-cystathionase and maltose regulon repressor activities
MPNSKTIQVTDLETNTTVNYVSITAASKALNINSRAISNYLIRGLHACMHACMHFCMPFAARTQIKPYNGRYVFTII